MNTSSFESINLFTIALVIMYILLKVTANISNGIVIPMIADCSDYVTYRTGRYVPDMMGTLFSFVDKIISSFAATIVGFSFAEIKEKAKAEQVAKMETVESDS